MALHFNLALSIVNGFNMPVILASVYASLVSGYLSLAAVQPMESL